ncbi:MAG: hypothetical protein ACLQUR_06280, partial [Limisphaerales bacterium]
MKQKIKFAVFSLLVCMLAAVARLNAQTFPEWDITPDFDLLYPPFGGNVPNNIVGNHGAGYGQDVYFLGAGGNPGKDAYYPALWRWNKCGGWQEVVQEINGMVFNALAIQSNYLYVVGSFTEVFPEPGQGVPATNIARYDLSSGQWSAVGTGITNGATAALTIDSFGNVYAGGAPNPAPLVFPGLMKWDGTNWTTVGGGFDSIATECSLTPPVNDCFEAGVFALATDGTNVYATGGFVGAWNDDGTYVTSHCVIKWNGSNWCSMGGLNVSVVPGQDGFTTADTSLSICVMGTNVFVGGSFDNAGSNGVVVPAGGIARFSATTGAALPCDSLWEEDYNPAIYGSAYSLAVLNGTVYVTGVFDAVGGVSANGIAQWNSSTATWSPLDSGLTVYSNVDGYYTNSGSGGVGSSLAANANAVFVTGAFDFAGGITISNYINPPSSLSIARWMITPDAPQPELNQPGFSSGTFSFNISGDANTSWTVYSSIDLTNWTPVGGVTLDGNGNSSYTDGNVNGLGYRFYRLSNGTCCSQAIGFERVTAWPGWTVIANQLDAPTNTLDGLFNIGPNHTMPDGTSLPAGTVICIANGQQPPINNEYTQYNWNGSQWSPNGNATLSPGDFAFIQNNSGTAFTVTFVGLVEEG